jgi:hypothetical protein
VRLRPAAFSDNVLVQYLLKQVMHWHLMLLAAFFLESQPPAWAIVIVIIDLNFSTALTRAKL